MMKYAFAKDNAIQKELTRKTCGSAGFDLYNAGEQVLIKPMETVRIKTGIKIEILKGYEGQIRLRSSFGKKHQMTIMTNHVGTIDSDYRGEILVELCNLGDTETKICKGEDFAQLVIAPIYHLDLELVDDDKLSDTGRGSGGYGSTDNCNCKKKEQNCIITNN